MNGQVTRIRIGNRLDEMAVLNDEVERLAARHQLPQRVVQEVGVALDEIVSNVIQHGFADDGEHHIDIRLQLLSGLLLVQVEDDGIEFDPLQHSSPELQGSMQERKIGGVGILFVRALMDSVSYRRVLGRNILEMTKRVTPSEPSQS